MESGERELPGPVTVVMETALGYLRKIQDLSRQLNYCSPEKCVQGQMEWTIR